MSLEPSEFRHVVVDGAGVAYISGTTMKVRELVLEQLAYGWTAEQLQRQHPYLSMSQVHAALAYYFEHQTSLDSEIQQDLAAVDRLSAAGLTPDALNKIRDTRLS